MHNGMSIKGPYMVLSRLCKANRQNPGCQDPWAVVKSTVHLYAENMAKNGRKRNKKNKKTGKRKPWKSAEQNRKQRKNEHDRMATFNMKKRKGASSAGHDCSRDGSEAARHRGQMRVG